MKVFLDQGVGRRAATLLRAGGVDAVHASEVGLSSADDRDILAWCRNNGAVAVTLDADFHAWIALSGETTPSSIRIRIQGLKGPQVAPLVLDILRTRKEELASGALVTVQRDRLRLRRLPIAPKGQ